MLRSKPRLTYSGLTVILSNLSRFDVQYNRLLSCGGGELFNNHCLRPELNLMQCDVRVSEDKSPFLDGTRCILLLGERALIDWLPECINKTLNEVRGGVYYINGIPAICSFYPQDAADLKGHEQRFNTLDKDYSPDTDDYEDEEKEDSDSEKKLGRTRRSNYAFWLRADTRKAKIIIKEGVLQSDTKPRYITYPSGREVCEILTKTQNRYLYLDLETDYEEQNIQCFSFSFDGNIIYCVPVLDHNYKAAYSSVPFIFRALSVAIRNNTVVCHNGACFDFLVLAAKYNIPIYKCYDTMIAMHRCFPDVEKSLGHCVSYWTWERFHKDEDSSGYNTQEQMMARLKYCGKDVYTLFLVHQAIEKYARTIPGLSDSIAVAMASIRPYLITTLQGIKYSQEKVKTLQDENDALMTQYLRIISLLLGEHNITEIQNSVKSGKKSIISAGGKDYRIMLPGSNTQCCRYFHDMLGYSVMHRSDKTDKPSLGKKQMYKLALQHPDNPVIQLILAYRVIAKEHGTLKFVPWRGDDNKIINFAQHQLTANQG